MTFQVKYPYTKAIADQICEKVENGTPLSRVCKMEGFPSPSVVYYWLRKIPEFEQQYGLAKRNQLELMAEEILEIADDSAGDKGNSANVNRARLMVDARKFILERLMPEKFGNKMRNEISGPNGGPVASVEVDKEELARMIAFVSSQKKEVA